MVYLDLIIICSLIRTNRITIDEPSYETTTGNLLGMIINEGKNIQLDYNFFLFSVGRFFFSFLWIRVIQFENVFSTRDFKS